MKIHSISHILQKYKYSILFFLILFFYILGLTSLFPMHTDHELIYDQIGNPFLLQWKEYFMHHGRLMTHILARYTLQSGYPYFHIIKSFVIFILYIVSLKTIFPDFLKNNNYFQKILLLSIFLIINALFPTIVFMMYYGTDLLYLYAYYISGIFIMIFLQYYINIYYNKTVINIPLFFLLAFITGASFEMSIACIPFIITIYILLKIKKIPIPRWFWYSIPFFLLGFSMVILAPGASNRYYNLENVRNWDFFGQTINLLNLGYKKYFYILVKNIFYHSDWWNAPGFLPTTWYIQALILFFTYLNYKHYKSFFHIKIILPILYYLFSWYTCIVMSVSPTYHAMVLEFSKFFMYISLTASIYYYLQTKSKKIQVCLCTIFFAIVFIGQGLQIYPIYKAKQEYLKLVNKIEKGEITKLSHDQFPAAKLGNIKILEFGESGLPKNYPHLFTESN